MAKGNNNNSNKNNNNNNNNKSKSKKKVSNPNQPFKSKHEKDLEALRKTQQEALIAIENARARKISYPKCVTSSFSLVFAAGDTNKTLTESVPDLSPYWSRQTLSLAKYLPQDNGHSLIQVPNEGEESVVTSNPFFFLNLGSHDCLAFDLDQTTIDYFTTLIDDLDKLLSSEHNVFWSYIFFEPSILKFLESYLSYTSRPAYDFIRQSLLPLGSSYSKVTGGLTQDQKVLPSSPVHTLRSRVSALVFSILVRSSQMKESEVCFFSPSAYASRIEAHSVWNIAKLIDFAHIFGPHNQTLVAETVSRLFDSIPSLAKETKLSSTITCNTLETLTAVIIGSSSALPRAELDMYLFDIFSAMRETVVADPRLTHGYLAWSSDKSAKDNDPGKLPSTLSFIPLLTSYYHYYIPYLSSIRPTWWTSTIGNLLSMTVADLIYIHLSHNYFNVLIPGRARDVPKKMASILASKPYVETMEDLVAAFDLVFYDPADLPADASEAGIKAQDRLYHLFIRNYSLTSLLRELIQCGHKDVDTDRLEYYRSIIGDTTVLETKVSSAATPTTPTTTTTTSAAKDPRTESMITQITDLMPELGEGWILKALATYGWDVEATIHHIFENDLSPELKTLDRGIGRDELLQLEQADAKGKGKGKAPIIYQAEEEQQTEEEEELTVSPALTMLQSRRNIFQGDAFDRADASIIGRVHVGKRTEAIVGRKYGFGKELDEEDSEHLKSLINVRQQQLLYEDEYDDSYDEFARFGLGEGETETEKKSTRVGKTAAQNDEDETDEGADINISRGGGGGGGGGSGSRGRGGGRGGSRGGRSDWSSEASYGAERYAQKRQFAAHQKYINQVKKDKKAAAKHESSSGRGRGGSGRGGGGRGGSGRGGSGRGGGGRGGGGRGGGGRGGGGRGRGGSSTSDYWNQKRVDPRAEPQGRRNGLEGLSSGISYRINKDTK